MLEYTMYLKPVKLRFVGVDSVTGRVTIEFRPKYLVNSTIDIFIRI